jgi:hypothetical protein
MDPTEFEGDEGKTAWRCRICGFVHYGEEKADVYDRNILKDEKDGQRRQHKADDFFVIQFFHPVLLSLKFLIVVSLHLIFSCLIPVYPG